VSDLIPAATVILIRDGGEGVETLMLHRNSKVAFGGMWVFPGGRIDPGDVDLSAPDDELAAARRAACREALEEAALAVDIDGLVPFSHRIPPENPSFARANRRFATWFFLAPAPDGAAVVVAGGVIHDPRWLRPADAIARRDAGEIELAPPTWVTLWRLAGASSIADAVAMARASQPERFETRIAVVDGALYALWHGDAGYESGDPAVDGDRHRLLMLPDGWRYERSGTSGLDVDSRT
jgi:8-oxo-dGTP pyrophosphatase MutT (NUDIX family)